jgi:hypothetical protein
MRRHLLFKIMMSSLVILIQNHGVLELAAPSNCSCHHDKGDATLISQKECGPQIGALDEQRLQDQLKMTQCRQISHGMVQMDNFHVCLA